MAAREVYVRLTDTQDGFDITPGIEGRPGDNVTLMLNVLRRLAKWGHTRAPDHEAVVELIEGFIKIAWPSRAYFIETETDGGGVQVYQPWGMPRER